MQLIRALIDWIIGLFRRKTPKVKDFRIRHG